MEYYCAGVDMLLSELKIGETAKVISIENHSFTRRLMEMGFCNGVSVEVYLKGMSKSLRVYKVKNTLIALRKETADKINVIPV